MDNYYILLPQEIIFEKNLSETAIAVYTAIMFLSSKKLKYDCISPRRIGCLMYGDKPSVKNYKSIVFGLEQLISKEIITVKTSMENNEYMIDFSKLFQNTTSVKIQVYRHEFTSIFNFDTKRDKFKIFKCFLGIVSTFSGSTSLDEQFRYKIGFLPVSYIGKKSNLSYRAVLGYREILAENKLIYIINHEEFWVKRNNLGHPYPDRVNDTYSRYVDKDLCVEYDEKNKKLYKKMLEDEKERQNQSRRLTQKYYSFKNGKKYDKETIKELYLYARNWNETEKERYENSLGNSSVVYNPKYKDMTIFIKYKDILRELFI